MAMSQGMVLVMVQVMVLEECQLTIKEIKESSLIMEELGMVELLSIMAMDLVMVQGMAQVMDLEEW